MYEESCMKVIIKKYQRRREDIHFSHAETD